MSQNDSYEPVTVTDKRRIDPETGEIRPPTRGAEEHEQATGPAPSGPAPEAAGDTSEEVTELKSTLQRVKAEYDNYRKRSLRDQQLTAERTKAAVVMQLLPVLDDLDRAREHGDLVGPFASVAESLTAVTGKLGLTAFGEKGDPFDPNRHEAVAHQTSADVTEPTCVEVMRRGYTLGERLLRPALVAVADPE